MRKRTISSRNQVTFLMETAFLCMNGRISNGNHARFYEIFTAKETDDGEDIGENYTEDPQLGRPSDTHMFLSRL